MRYWAITAVTTAVLIGASAGAVTMSAPQPTQSDQFNPMIDGQAISPDLNIGEGIAQSPEHKAFTAALKSTKLDALLKTAGPYTVFAPNDMAFARLSLNASMDRTMRYAIVPGRLDSQAMLKLINDNGGAVKLPTLEGGSITVTLNGPTNIVLMDEEGNFANIAIYDIYQANGVVQVVDRVLMPKGSEKRLAAR